MSAADETIPVEEAAALGDTIDQTLWAIGTRPRWCDVCLKSSVRKIVRHSHHITIEGAVMGERVAFYCFDEQRFIRDGVTR